jgi:hypothetical protein
MSEDVRKRLSELEAASLEGGGKERERVSPLARRVRGARGVICVGCVGGTTQGPPGELLDADVGEGS